MRSRKNRAAGWKIYSIIDKNTMGKKDPSALARKVFKNGVMALQLRCKNAPSYSMVALAKKISSLAKKNKSFFLINDRPDLALASRASGIHLGEGDPGLKTVRVLLGDGAIAGKTVHSLNEARKAKKEPFDYISAGAVYATPLKRRLKGRGAAFIKRLKRISEKPLLAIGGINEKNAKAVLAAGADGICVARASLKIEKIVNALK